MDRRSLLIAFSMVALPWTSSQAQSNDRTAAEGAAAAFLQKLDTGDLTSLYHSDMGPRFKANVSEASFAQNGGMLKIQLGGIAQARRLVGAQALDQVPNISERGSYYYVRYHSRFPTGPAFQDVYLEKVSGAWKVVGFWFLPAPAQ